MGDPRHRGANFDYALQRKRNYGVSEHGQDRSVDDEFKRRIPDAEATPVSVHERTSTPSLATSAAGVNPTPAVAPGPDRVHKYGKYYVLVSANHISGDDIVPNPMYAPSSLVSTIAAGYTKAKSLAASITDPNARVSLVIMGGAYNESLQLDSGLVDVYGEGHPVIAGTLEVMPTVSRIRIDSLELFNTGSNLAMWIHAAPDTTWTTRPYYDAPIQIRNCIVHAEQQAVQIERRTYISRSDVWTDTNDGASSGLATVRVIGSASDRGNTVFSHSRIWSYAPYAETTDNTAGLQPNWYAVIATSKAGAYQPTTGGYLLPSQQIHNGVAFDHCDVFGTIRCEAWKVSSLHSSHHGGIPTASFSSSIAFELVGWYLWDEVNGYYDTNPALVSIDNGIVDSSYIAQFEYDHHQANPYVWGGHIYIRNTVHLNRKQGPNAAPYINPASVGSADVVDSSTSAPSWLVSGMVVTVTNSPANVGGMLGFYFR